MSASYRRTNYSLRPAKHAERKMISEIFRHLYPFHPVDEYIYVGFGSLWFTDFIILHRALGIRNMISIERSAGAKKRFEANKPFEAIKIDYQESWKVLPKLNWDQRHFAWLDYDDPLSTDMLKDAGTVATKATSGTVLAISVQCHQANEVAAAAEDPSGPSALALFRGTFGRQRVRENLDGSDLYGWPFGTTSRDLIKSEIEAALAVRNSSSTDANIIKFIPICDIEYEDGVKMTTTIGIFVSNSEMDILTKCKFDKLDFMPKEGNLIRIKVPLLTIREIRHLEQQLPIGNREGLNIANMPSSDANAFADLYRYFPNFGILEA